MLASSSLLSDHSEMLNCVVEHSFDCRNSFSLTTFLMLLMSCLWECGQCVDDHYCYYYCDY